MNNHRILVSLSEPTLEAVERLQKSGVDNKRFGCEPGSFSETVRRLVIIALEAREGEGT